MNLHPKQKEIARNKARFKVIRAGRKGGKTSLEVETLTFKATVSSKYLGVKKKEFATGRKVIYIAPTQLQARNIIWEALKNRLKGVGVPNEQLLQMKVKNEDGNSTTIFVGGYENRENYRGLTDVVHITFDEVDTFKDFFIAWKEIFRPMFLDTAGTADFVGTPKKENPNLKRLELEFESLGEDFSCFHFTSKDNPFLPVEEINKLEKEYENDRTSYKQEILAEYVENEGALFRFSSLLDIFSNTVDQGQKYLTVDIADDGSDKTIFNFWCGTESYRIEQYSRLNTEGVINQIRDYASEEKIPYSHIAVDAIGVGAGVASSSLLDGIVGFKGSYQAIQTDSSPVKLPNIHYTKEAPLVSDYRNLRSQCIFEFAKHVQNHAIACSVKDTRIKENLIEELSAFQDVSKGDGKRMATMTEDIKQLIGRSPDLASTFFMRMYFEIREDLSIFNSETMLKVRTTQQNHFDRVHTRRKLVSNK